MKRFGCGLAVVGTVLALASFVLFGTSFYGAITAREVTKLPIETGVPFDTGLVTVDTSKLVQVAVAARVRSTHVRNTRSGDGLDLVYRFPFRYTVFDEAGLTLWKGDELLDHDEGMRTVTASVVTDAGGSERVEKPFAKFAVAKPGTIRVVGRLDADGDYGATAEEARLVIYDRATKQVRRVAAGFVLLGVGGLAAVVGLALYVIAFIRSPAAPSAPA
jgi:hypothetical protein